MVNTQAYVEFSCFVFITQIAILQIQDARAAMAIYRLYKTDWNEPLGLRASATYRSPAYVPSYDWLAQESIQFEDDDDDDYFDDYYDDPWDIRALEWGANSESD
jgi:hypothetical protein